MRRNLAASAWAFSFQELGTQPVFRFPVDKVIGKYSYRNPLLRGVRSKILFRGATHIAIDGFLTYYRAKQRGWIGKDARWLTANGYQIGFVAHGSDVRDPDRHLARDQWSYFRDSTDDWVDSMRESTARHREVAEDSGLPLFYSTPDLGLDLPAGTWLPVCVDVDEWKSDRPLLERSRPRVLHVPSHQVIKGTRHIDPVLEDLADRGLIEYVSPKAVPHEQMRSLVQSCDVVVDQLLTGSYGVAAVEAMAAGRVVVGRLHEDVKGLLPEVPHIVDATPENLRDVITSILDQRDVLRQQAYLNTAFVNRWHSGSEAAQRLVPFLGLETGS